MRNNNIDGNGYDLRHDRGYKSFNIMTWNLTSSTEYLLSALD